MPDPLVVTVMRQHREALLAREAMQMQQMAGQWLMVERALEAKIALLAREAADLKAAGKAVDPRRIYQMTHYQELLPQVKRELENYADYTVRVVTEAQRQYVQLGLFDAADAISASYQSEARLGLFFHRLPVEAVENMVGLAGDGSPLKSLLTATWHDAAGALTDALVRGTAMGINPRQVAVEMRHAMAGQGLGRAIVIARTEELRVYRQASISQYQASGVVQGYLRGCAHDSRICAACLLMEGTRYDTAEVMQLHPCDRCYSIPVLIGMAAPQWTRGADWLIQQPEDTQRAILGRGHYDGWKAGKFDLDQLVTIKHNDTWGDSLGVTPLKDLLKARTPVMKPLKDPTLGRVPNGANGQEKVEALVNDASFYNKSTESAYIYANDGSLIASREGVEHDIDLSGIKVKDTQNAHFIHNHPSGDLAIDTWTFSDTDIETAVGGNFSTMTATGKYRTYTMSRPPDGWLDHDTIMAATTKQLKFNPEYVKDFIRYRDGSSFGDSPETLNRDAKKFWRTYSEISGSTYKETKRRIAAAARGK